MPQPRTLAFSRILLPLPGTRIYKTFIPIASVLTSARIRSFKMQQHHFYYIMTSWPLQYMSNLLIKKNYVHGFLFYIKMCKCLYRVSRLMVTSVFKFALGLNVLMASLNIVVTRYSMQILRKPITVHCKCFIHLNN